MQPSLHPAPTEKRILEEQIPSAKKILVTGAAGFLGSHLCDALLASGSSVIAVDNLLTGRRDNLQHLARESRFEFVECDICRPFDFGRVDQIYHLASPASPVDYMTHGIATLKVGAEGTFNALELAKKYSARFFLASTSECYGDPLEHPQRESYWGHVNPIGPRSVYDEAKRFSEAATMAAHRYWKVDSRIVRIFNTHRPHMQLNDGRVIPNFMKHALRGEPLTVYGDGSQTRSFCYVSDEVDGFLRLMGSAEILPVNIGNPSEFTLPWPSVLPTAATGVTDFSSAVKWLESMKGCIQSCLLHRSHPIKPSFCWVLCYPHSRRSTLLPRR